MSGCWSAETPPNSNANSNARAANAANAANIQNAAPLSNAVAVTTPTPSGVSNDAPTLSPVYKAYCAAMVKKDDAAVRKMWSSDSLKAIEADMKADGVAKITDFMDPVSMDKCEVRDETVKGDKAVARVITVSYPEGFDVLFVKENGEWKMSTMDPKAGMK